jgi:hypothetical protein
MIKLERDQRNQRRTKPGLECLDERIAPTTLQPAVAVGGAMAASMAVRSKEHNVDALSVASRGAESHERRPAELIARPERAVERHELRLARLEARYLAHHHTAADPPVQVKVRASASSGSNTGIHRSNTSTSGAITRTSFSAPTAPPTTSGVGTQGSVLPSNVSQTLDVIYQAYEQDPSGFDGNVPATNGANLVVIQGSNVGIQVHDGNPSDFSTLVTELQIAGMQITASSATYGLVEGMLPIASLPTIAGLPQAASVMPMFQPLLG